MNVSMYEYVYVSICECMYVCVYVWNVYFYNICMIVCMYPSMFVCMYVCTYEWKHVCMCLFLYNHVLCMYECMFVSIYVYVFI